MHLATEDLIKFLEEIDVDKYIKNLEKIDEEIHHLRKERDKLACEVKKAEFLKDKKLVKIDEILERAKKGEIVEFYSDKCFSLDKETLEYYRNRFRLNGYAWGVKRIKDYFGEYVYVNKNDKE
jgi:DNA relaxase NicK